MSPQAMAEDAAFSDWGRLVRALLDTMGGKGMAAIAGSDDDMRGYYEDGYKAADATAELMTYAAENS